MSKQVSIIVKHIVNSAIEHATQDQRDAAQDSSVLSYVNKAELINSVVNGLVDSAVTLAYQTDLSVKQKQIAIISLFKTVHRCFQNESCTIVLQQLICNKFLTLSLSIFDN